MRFMMLMIPGVYANGNGNPVSDLDPKAVEVMMAYNHALKDAGVLVSLDGLHPPSDAARVTFAGGKPKVTDGPFTEAKEVLGGYWIIDVKSKAEAIEWARKIPAAADDVVEVRQIQAFEEFSPDVQAVIGSPDALGTKQPS